jgi:hypothetical protein
VDITAGVWITESCVAISLGDKSGYSLQRDIDDLQQRRLPNFEVAGG